jgi:hypothetical protein
VGTDRSFSAVLLLLGCGNSAPRSVDATPSLVCGDPPRGPAVAWFRDVTVDSGVAFQYVSPDGFRTGAVLAADLDGDGLPDVIAGSRAGGVAVYHNLGGLRFAPVATSGIDTTQALSAVAAADLDNDGDIDLVLASPGVAVVMANQGNGSFVQVARFDNSGTTEQVLPVDLDGDGLLDLLFANREYPVGAATENLLYLNKGQLQFTLTGAVPPTGLSWSATAFDFDHDGDQDLYIANDTLIPDFGPGGLQEPTSLQPDALLRNDGPGLDGVPRFTDLAGALGMAQPRSSMGGTLGDYDGDGEFDIYVPNLGANKLFIRTGATFTEQALARGVDATMHRDAMCSPGTTEEDCLIISWSSALTDLDLDGYDDLLVVNGSNFDGSIQAPTILYQGAPDGFHEVSPDLGCLNARGLVVTDLDGDGDQDVLIAQTNGALMLYENRNAPATTAWLDVTLHGTTSNRDGVGAVVTVHLASGRTLVKAVGSGGVINSASPAEAFFGLGGDIVASIEVAWPSGRHSTIAGPMSGRIQFLEP